MQKLYKGLLFAWVAAVVFAGSAVAQDSRNVYLIQKNLVNPFCVDVQSGALQAAKDKNINLTVLTPLIADNVEEMTQLTEQAVAAGDCDVLIMFTADSVGIIPVTEMVHEAGIPVVLLNTSLSTDHVFWKTFVSCENREVGLAIGEALAAKMGGKGKVILLEGVSGAQISIDRIGGIRDVIAKYPDMEIVASQPANMNRAMAMEVTQNLLQAHLDVSGILTINDEMALGAIEAVQAAGKADQIIVGGCNADREGRIAVKEGRMAFTCDIRAFDQGYQAVAAAGRILDGEEVAQNIVVQMKVVDPSNIHEYLD